MPRMIRCVQGWVGHAFHQCHGGLGCEIQECLSRLRKRLVMKVGVCESEVALSQVYCLLAVTLMRQNARAIILRLL